MKFSKLLFWPGVLLLSFGCANKVLKIEHPEQIKVSNEFEKSVKIEEVKESTPSAKFEDSKNAAANKTSKNQDKTVVVKNGKSEGTSKTDVQPKKKGKKSKVEPQPPELQKRQPEIEGEVGFAGRRPINDPFRVGEKVTHKVKYLSMEAGEIDFEVRPLVMVNNQKSYTFRVAVRTSPFFSKFYSVNDYAETLVDFETMVPSVFSLHVQETGQIKEAKSFFDQSSLHATFWENKVTEKSGKEEKKLEWEIAPYSQNVFSSLFYLRAFHWEVGAENRFIVSDDGKNLLFKGKALRKEKISTDVGELDTLVIQPEFTLQGKFQPVGDIFFWITDDERKLLVRIEAKIKIGSLVSEVSAIQKN